MERVTFLLQGTGERLSCMLNPESLVQNRTAGMATYRGGGGLVSGTELSDDPVFFTGGGATDLELDLLFDCSLVRDQSFVTDVRKLTHPILQLAENHIHTDHYGEPPIVRFIWGKSWNMPGAVVAVAERLEMFNSDGEPQRSWLRMRMRRISERQSHSAQRSERNKTLANLPAPDPTSFNIQSLPEDSLPILHETAGVGSVDLDADSIGSTPLAQDRLDQIANRYYGAPSLWRLIAGFNDIVDPLRVRAGQLLALPSIDTATNTQSDSQ